MRKQSTALVRLHATYCFSLMRHANTAFAVYGTGGLLPVRRLRGTGELWTKAVLRPVRRRHTCLRMASVGDDKQPTTRLELAPVEGETQAEPSAEMLGTQGRRGKRWVATASIQNALCQNHFLDVLEMYGAEHGLRRDTEFPGYEAAGSYPIRLRELSAEFRRQVTGAIVRRVGQQNVAVISKVEHDPDDVVALCARTAEAMAQGKQAIVGAVLADDEHRIFCRVPLLMRSKIAQQLLHVSLDGKRKETSAQGNGVSESGENSGGDDSYVAVQMKRRQIDVDEQGFLRAKSLARAQIELWLWNKLLRDAQGSECGAVVLIGLHKNRVRPIARGAFVAAAESSSSSHGDAPLAFDHTVWKPCLVKFGGNGCRRGVSAMQALQWRCRVVDEGAAWIEDALSAAAERQPHSSLPQGRGLVALTTRPPVPELRPNMKCASMQDFPWAKAKRMIAEAIGEVTLVSGISRTLSIDATRNGVNDFRNERATGEALGATSLLTSSVLAMHKAGYDGPKILPTVIAHNRGNWRRLQGFKNGNVFEYDRLAPQLPMADQRTFYVDFELAAPDGLKSHIPNSAAVNGIEACQSHTTSYDLSPAAALHDENDGSSSSLIFVIGCGQVINGEWRHRVFVADRFSESAEAACVAAWLAHMQAMLPLGETAPILNVWGPERQLLKRALRRMERVEPNSRKRTRADSLHIVDILRVATTACFAVQGALNHSLKSVTKALEAHGVLEDFAGQSRSNGVSDGADAMALGLAAAETAARSGLSSMADAPEMEAIIHYNESDCRDLARIATYLRSNH